VAPLTIEQPIREDAIGSGTNKTFCFAFFSRVWSFQGFGVSEFWDFRVLRF
jgi:hypothetical protein